MKYGFGAMRSEAKRQSFECKHHGSAIKKKFKSQWSNGKVMLKDFWDMSGPNTGVIVLRINLKNFTKKAYKNSYTDGRNVWQCRKILLKNIKKVTFISTRKIFM